MTRSQLVFIWLFGLYAGIGMVSAGLHHPIGWVFFGLGIIAGFANILSVRLQTLDVTEPRLMHCEVCGKQLCFGMPTRGFALGYCAEHSESLGAETFRSSWTEDGLRRFDDVKMGRVPEENK